MFVISDGGGNATSDVDVYDAYHPTKCLVVSPLRQLTTRQRKAPFYQGEKLTIVYSNASLTCKSTDSSILHRFLRDSAQLVSDESDGLTPKLKPTLIIQTNVADNDGCEFLCLGVKRRTKSAACRIVEAVNFFHRFSAPLATTSQLNSEQCVCGEWMTGQHVCTANPNLCRVAQRAVVVDRTRLCGANSSHNAVSDDACRKFLLSLVCVTLAGVFRNSETLSEVVEETGLKLAIVELTKRRKSFDILQLEHIALRLCEYLERVMSDMTIRSNTPELETLQNFFDSILSFEQFLILSREKHDKKRDLFNQLCNDDRDWLLKLFDTATEDRLSDLERLRLSTQINQLTYQSVIQTISTIKRPSFTEEVKPPGETRTRIGSGTWILTLDIETCCYSFTVNMLTLIGTYVGADATFSSSSDVFDLFSGCDYLNTLLQTLASSGHMKWGGNSHDRFGKMVPQTLILFDYEMLADFSPLSTPKPNDDNEENYFTFINNFMAFLQSKSQTHTTSVKNRTDITNGVVTYMDCIFGDNNSGGWIIEFVALSLLWIVFFDPRYQHGSTFTNFIIFSFKGGIFDSRFFLKYYLSIIPMLDSLGLFLHYNSVASGVMNVEIGWSSGQKGRSTNKISFQDIAIKYPTTSLAETSKMYNLAYPPTTSANKMVKLSWRYFIDSLFLLFTSYKRWCQRVNNKFELLKYWRLENKMSATTSDDIMARLHDVVNSKQRQGSIFQIGINFEMEEQACVMFFSKFGARYLFGLKNSIPVEFDTRSSDGKLVCQPVNFNYALHAFIVSAWSNKHVWIAPALLMKHTFSMDEQQVLAACTSMPWGGEELGRLIEKLTKGTNSWNTILNSSPPVNSVEKSWRLLTKVNRMAIFTWIALHRAQASLTILYCMMDTNLCHGYAFLMTEAFKRQLPKSFYGPHHLRRRQLLFTSIKTMPELSLQWMRQTLHDLQHDTHGEDSEEAIPTTDIEPEEAGLTNKFKRLDPGNPCYLSSDVSHPSLIRPSGAVDAFLENARFGGMVLSPLQGQILHVDDLLKRNLLGQNGLVKSNSPAVRFECYDLASSFPSSCGLLPSGSISQLTEAQVDAINLSLRTGEFVALKHRPFVANIVAYLPPKTYQRISQECQLHRDLTIARGPIRGPENKIIWVGGGCFTAVFTSIEIETFARHDQFGDWRLRVCAVTNVEAEGLLRGYKCPTDMFRFGVIFQSWTPLVFRYFRLQGNSRAEAKRAGDGLKSQACKLAANSCIGKFGKKPDPFKQITSKRSWDGQSMTRARIIGKVSKRPNGHLNAEILERVSDSRFHSLNQWHDYGMCVQKPSLLTASVNESKIGSRNGGGGSVANRGSIPTSFVCKSLVSNLPGQPKRFMQHAVFMYSASRQILRAIVVGIVDNTIPMDDKVLESARIQTAREKLNLGESRFTLQGAIRGIHDDVYMRPTLMSTSGFIVGAAAGLTPPNVFYIDTDSVILLSPVVIDPMHITRGQLECWSKKYGCIRGVFDNETVSGGYDSIGVVARKAYFCTAASGVKADDKIRYKGMSTQPPERVSSFCCSCVRPLDPEVDYRAVDNNELGELG